MRRHIWFVGIRTAGSAAVRAFPAWMDVLGSDARLSCADLPLDSSADAYRELVRAFAASEDAIGAVITGHKARLFEHARDELDVVDEPAWACRELSVLYRRGVQVHGTAIEIDSTRQALATIAPAAHWRTTGGELLVLGAGGTAAALLAAIFTDGEGRRDGPRRVHLFDVVADRARQLSELVASWSPRTTVTAHPATDAGMVMAGLAPHSLIVNATGVGKDTPGSPVTLPAAWPRHAIFWEVNYRGELAMLGDAIAAAPERELRVHDGWSLFIAGWAEALGTMLGRAVSDQQRTAMERSGRAARA